MKKSEEIKVDQATVKNENQYHKSSLRIFWGLLAGALVGVILNNLGPQIWIQNLLKYILDPIGQVFLRALFMIVVPLVFSSLCVGVARLGSIENVKSLGLRVGGFYMGTTLIAICIGQFLVMNFKPGVGLDPEMMNGAREAFSAQVSSLMEKSESVPENLWPGLISAVVPRNVFLALSGGDMLAIIFTAILFGISLTFVDSKKSEVVLSFFDAISESMVRIVGWIMFVAPLAVGALMAVAVSKFGMSLLSSVLQYIAVVIIGYTLHLFGTYSLILKFILRISPITFFRKAFPVLATSFSTSSSNATIPTTIRTLEKSFNVPPTIARFCVPLGATVNMDGTALFEMVAALFVAQIFGVELTLASQISLILLVLLTSIGVAGIPGGSVPILMSAMGIVGIPPEGIALILGVDRLLDMGRTVVNVSGDMVATLFASRPFKQEKT